MQTPLLEKIASGHLLPYLQCLTLSSTSARNMLEFVRKRYEYAAYSMHVPTTSQHHGVTIPRPLVSVCLTHLQIGNGNENENGDPRAIFDQLCRQCVGTRIKILNVILWMWMSPMDLGYLHYWTLMPFDAFIVDWVLIFSQLLASFFIQ